MKTLTFLTCSILFLLGGSANAFQWGQKVRIMGVYTYAGGGSYITTELNENPDNCASSRYLALDSSAPHFRYLYATALAAQLAGTTVSINYDGCFGSYPRVNSIAVPNVW